MPRLDLCWLRAVLADVKPDAFGTPLTQLGSRPRPKCYDTSNLEWSVIRKSFDPRARHVERLEGCRNSAEPQFGQQIV